MFYIDLATGNTFNSSGEKLPQGPHFTGFQQEEFEFGFMNGSERCTLPENCEIMLLGDVAEHFNSPMFAAAGTLSDDRTSASFLINTATETFDQRVKASSTPCIVDICLRNNSSGNYKRLIRFNAIADRRLFMENRPPEPLKNYYTSAQIDELLAGYELEFAAPEVNAVMLEYGEKPYADLSIAKENNQYKLNFSIAVPAGAPGADGKTGATGVAGKTPLRGVDYWTNEDIAAIKEYVETVILNGAW